MTSFKHPAVLPQEFFQNVRKLSQPKLRIYKSYFEAFVKRLKSNQQGIIFDGFAGQGVYKNGESTSDMVDLGSPLLALIPGIHYLNNHKQAKLKYIFVEKNEENYKVLIMNVTQCIHALLDTSCFKLIAYTENKLHRLEIVNNEEMFISLEIRNGRFSEHIHRFYDLEPNQRLLSVVDPFGYKELDNEDIHQLVGKNKDIIITFMAGLIKRYKVIQTHQETISNILNIEKEDLSDLNTPFKIAVQFGNSLNESNTEPIDPLYLKIKNTRKATIYVLVFITSSSSANIEMSKCFNLHRDKDNEDDEYEYTTYSWRECSTDNSNDDIIIEKIIKNGKTFRLIESKNTSKKSSFKNKSKVFKHKKSILNNKIGMRLKIKKTKTKSNDEKEYEVEEIVGDKIKNDKQYFLIKWKNYSHNQNTWEPKEHLNCSILLRKYNLKKYHQKRKCMLSQNIVNNSKKKKLWATLRTTRILERNRKKSNLEKKNESLNNSDAKSTTLCYTTESKYNYNSNSISKSIKTNIDCILLSSDDEYKLEVEKILDKKYENDKVYYLVKLKHPKNNNEWILKNELNCDDLIDQFEAEILQNEKDKLIRKSFEKERKKDDDDEIKEYINKRRVEKIIGMTQSKQKDILFAVKLSDSDDLVWVPNESAKKRCPQNVIKYYSEHINFVK